jgi:hypothetical protein
MLSFDRTTYLGSNETGIVTGASPAKSKRRLFEEKRGPMEPFQGNDLTELGLHNEGLILDKYADSLDYGLKLVTAYTQLEAKEVCKDGYFGLADTTNRSIPEIYHNSLHAYDTVRPWFRGTADALVMSLDRTKVFYGCDAKMVFDFRIGNMLKEGVMPPKFRAQGEHFCRLFRVNRWDFHCLLVDGSYGKYVTLTYDHKRDAEFAEGEWATICDNFWRDVQNNNPPPFDGNEGDDTPKLINARYPKDDEYETFATDAQIDAAELAVKHQYLSKKADGQYRAACGNLADTMNTYTKLVDDDGQIVVTRDKRGGMRFGKVLKARALMEFANEIGDDDE